MSKQRLEKDELLQLVKEHERIIFKICNSYCSNRDDRADLAQEIMYQLLKSYERYNATYKFSTWMYRIALNVAISFYRKTKTGKQVISLVEDHGELEDKENESAILEKNIHLLEQFITELKELDKALMILYLDEKNYREIGEILGITETNVATKISRIKEKLKQHFLKLT
jgi:RNA polymerase sigma-70 factor (ECF subfamily)